MAHQEPIRKRPGGPVREIPDKLYFRIGEVAKLCEVPAYVLRFWEGEFPQLKPNKGGTGQRLYRRRDVEMALRIKALLYDEGYTIAGARQAFKAELRTSRDAQQASQLSIDGMPERMVNATRLEALQKELRDLRDLLSHPPSFAPARLLSLSPVRPIRAPRPLAIPKPAPAPTPFPHPIDRSDRSDRRRPTPLFDDLSSED